VKSQKGLLVVVAIALTCWVESTTAQTPTTTLSAQELTDLFSRIDKDTERFAKTADKALDKSGYDGTERESELNRHLNDFKGSAEGMKNKFKDNQLARADIEDVLRRGVAVERFLKRNPLDGVEGDWLILRGDLERLAGAYGMNLMDGQFATAAKVGEADVRNLVKRINSSATQYKKSLEPALDNSRLDGTKTEDEINGYVKEFRESTDRLENNYKEDTAAQDAAEVIRRAKLIDGFMRKYPLTTQAQSDWGSVRTDVERLARRYSVYLQWQ
jgi:DNA repair exonuclease SbcCD ATPase subunit